jgi:hypothetical protein
MHFAAASQNTALDVNRHFNIKLMLKKHLFHLFSCGSRVNNNNQMNFSLSVK